MEDKKITTPEDRKKDNEISKEIVSVVDNVISVSTGLGDFLGRMIAYGISKMMG